MVGQEDETPCTTSPTTCFVEISKVELQFFVKEILYNYNQQLLISMVLICGIQGYLVMKYG